MHLVQHASVAATLALALVAAPTAHAQFKCVVDGKTSFQQMPCASEEGASRIKVYSGGGSPSGSPPSVSRKPNWGAIARGEPAIGMTFTELKQAIGAPDKSNLAEYEGKTSDQLIYYRGNRTLYVYVRDGIVTAIQDREGGEIKVAGPQKNPCPSPQQIRDLEFDASKIANRDNQAVQEALAKARACR